LIFSPARKAVDACWEVVGDLSIVRQRRLMKAFAAIKLKQKWMMPLCFPNHLASDLYLTLNAQIDL
jgi:hypothetical protein